jgi:hypothetical protein
LIPVPFAKVKKEDGERLNWNIERLISVVHDYNMIYMMHGGRNITVIDECVRQVNRIKRCWWNKRRRWIFVQQLGIIHKGIPVMLHGIYFFIADFLIEPGRKGAVPGA